MPSQKGGSGDTLAFSLIRGGVGVRQNREGSLLLHWAAVVGFADRVCGAQEWRQMTQKIGVESVMEESFLGKRAANETAAASHFFGPAKNALIPRLVGDQGLLAASSLSEMASQLTMLIGPALGGALLALFGMSSAILVDAACFLFSALMAGLVVSPAPEASLSASDAGTSAWERLWRQYREGISLMRHNGVVIALMLAMGFTEVGQGLINVVMIPWVIDGLHGDSLVLGWIVSAQ